MKFWHVICPHCKMDMTVQAETQESAQAKFDIFHSDVCSYSPSGGNQTLTLSNGPAAPIGNVVEG